MRRRHAFAHRLVAGLLALWFAVVATEGARVHACAMHGGAAADAMMAGMSHAGHAMPGAMLGDHAAANAPQPGDDAGAHQCTCPDASCGSAIVAMAAARLTTHFGIAVADVGAVFSPASGRHPVAPPYLTPFANGPPSRALA